MCCQQEHLTNSKNEKTVGWQCWDDHRAVPTKQGVKKQDTLSSWLHQESDHLGWRMVVQRLLAGHKELQVMHQLLAGLKELQGDTETDQGGTEKDEGV